MATAEVAPIIDSAQKLEPGIADEQLKRDPVLPGPGSSGSFPPSNIFAEFLSPDQLPNPRPSRVQFAAMRDPTLQMVQAIPLDVSIEESAVEGSAVVVCWSEIDEFGTGETLSLALDDFSHALRELYRRLHERDINLGPDLGNVKGVLDKYIVPRT
jgi:hypothetical protein